MPSKIRKRTRKSRLGAKLDDKTINILFHGDFEGFIYEHSVRKQREQEFKNIWNKYESYLMNLWQSENYKGIVPLKFRLFSRPWAWRLDMSEPKKIIYTEFGGSSIESDKDYLIRLNLLTDKEKEILKREQGQN